MPDEARNLNASADEERLARIHSYRFIANLLRHPPDVTQLEQMAMLERQAQTVDDYGFALQMLGLAAAQCGAAEIDDEFHALFIGLGRGELVPYGSWYLTGYLMEQPLAALRSDLARLGMVRNEDSHEPEDHVAALLEVMAFLIESEDSRAVQQQFFHSHIAPWMARFFNDLTVANNAVFYRAVGRLGMAFLRLESSYL